MSNDSNEWANVPSFPRKINFALQEGVCNQRCPKCFVHGTNNDGEVKLAGTMPRDQIARLLEEAGRHSSFVSAGFFSEPMVAKDFEFFVREAKVNGLPVDVCTNGMLLTEEMSTFLLDMQVELLSISIDAAGPEVFREVRGVNAFDKVVRNTRRFLEMRGDREKPRVTVSFGIEDANRHEKQAFVDSWTPYADCVKIYGVYGHEKRLYDVDVVSDRLPCREVFDQMSVYFDGRALMCCLDGHAATNLGNVFESDIETVWHSDEYQKVRDCHIRNDYSDLEFCADCRLWASFDIVEEEVVGDVLVRRSEGVEYHNRLDRLQGWTDQTKRIELANLFEPH